MKKSTVAKFAIEKTMTTLPNKKYPKKAIQGN
jgi:hypothetical protein